MYRYELIKSVRSAIVDGEMLWNDDPHVISLARKHDLEHYVNPDKAYLAQYRATIQTKTLDGLVSLFHELGTDYMLLKGSVIRSLYPEPWMRTSADIDILVRESDLERIVEKLKQVGYDHTETANNHAVLKSQDGVTIEIHYDLTKTNTDKQTRAVLDSVWDHKDEPAMFYCHVISHMAGHFMSGGCGMRSIIDLYLLRDYDRSLVEQAGLSKFEETARNLALKWMEGAEVEIDKEFEDWIVNGGMYGTIAQATKARKLTDGNPRVLARRLFPTFDEMKVYFPTIRHKYELPIYWVRRVVKHIGHFGLRRITPELRSMKNSNTEEQQSIAKMFERVGLKVEN